MGKHGKLHIYMYKPFCVNLAIAMDKFKRSLSLRKKKEATPESSKPYLWQEDERRVREGICSFQVRVSGSSP